MGRADYLEEGSWNARCSMCNAKRKASELVKNWQGQWRCPEHNEPRHPQDFVRGVPDIQMAPWVQQPGVVANDTAYLLVEESETSLDLSVLFTATYTGTSGQVGTSGISTVVVNIQPGNTSAQVIINALSVGTTWPAGVTTIIINVYGGGIVLAYSDGSGLSVTINRFGGRLTQGTSYSLTAALVAAGTFAYLDTSVLAPGYGSITPGTYLGVSILGIGTDILLATTTSFFMNGSLSQSYFTTLILNSVSFTSASASFLQISGYTVWTWTTQAVLSAGTYTFTLS